MKTTKTFAYALACIRELARRQGQFVMVSEVASAQNIPAAYCQKILFSLAKSGIVLSAKGQGFCLIQEPGDISTLKVLQAFSDENTAEPAETNSSARSLSEILVSKVNGALATLTVAEILIASR